MIVRKLFLSGLTPHIAALAAITLCAWLAAWQFDRAGFKLALTEAWERAPTVDLGALPADDHLPFAQVESEGRFDPVRHILLDNQIRAGRSGVHVFTPFQPANSSATWLVNRGWHSLPPRDQALPDIDSPGGTLALRGRLTEPPRVGVPLGRSGPLDENRWPNLMTYLDLNRIRDALGAGVPDRVILLDPEHPAHLTGDEWRPIVFGPERHRAYAWQWITMAAAIFLIWLILTLRSFTSR